MKLSPGGRKETGSFTYLQLAIVMLTQAGSIRTGGKRFSLTGACEQVDLGRARFSGSPHGWLWEMEAGRSSGFVIAAEIEIAGFTVFDARKTDQRRLNEGKSPSRGKTQI